MTQTEPQRPDRQTLHESNERKSGKKCMCCRKNRNQKYKFVLWKERNITTKNHSVV